MSSAAKVTVVLIPLLPTGVKFLVTALKRMMSAGCSIDQVALTFFPKSGSNTFIILEFIVLTCCLFLKM